MVQILISQPSGSIVQTTNLTYVRQGTINRVHNVQMYVSKFVVYAKFLEAVQSFANQYNKLLFFSFNFALLSSLTENYFGFCLSQSFSMSLQS